MSFYFTITSAQLNSKHAYDKDKVAIVITSETNRLVTYFTKAAQTVEWLDAFVSQSNERQFEIMLIKEIVPGRKAKKLSSTLLNLSKYLFWQNDRKDKIPLYKNNIHTDTLEFQVCYREKKNYIGPIEFYRRGSDEVDEDQVEGYELQIEDDDSRFRPLVLAQQNKNKEIEAKFNGTIKEQVKFYKGAHKNRNVFSFCDQVFDDQKFTVVENCYDDQ